MPKKNTVTVHNVEQKTPEWFALRNQYPLTASEAHTISVNGKGLETLVWEKLAERYSSADKDQYSNPDIERGIELEAQARSLYELETGETVETVGFVTNESISPVAGASPDGLINGDGLLEIKCPNDTKHFRLIAGETEVETAHGWQVQMQMLITGRKWCDVCYFNPNFKKSLVVIRVKADEDAQAALKEGLKKGEALIKVIEAKL